MGLKIARKLRTRYVDPETRHPQCGGVVKENMEAVLVLVFVSRLV